MENEKKLFMEDGIFRNRKLLERLFLNYIRDDGFICGGFARVCVEDRKVIIPCRDIDIYCKNVEAFDRIKNRLLNNFYVLKIENEIASTIVSSFDFEGELPLQLIRPLSQGHLHVTSENIMDILNNFDFTVVRVGILANIKINENTKKENVSFKVFKDQDFDRDNKNKELIIKNIHCPVAEFYRVFKYLKKGYKIRISQIIKILQDWENRPVNYKNSLIEKLGKENPTQEEIDELEKLLHID